MSEPFVFDPRRSEYKTPFGAVPCHAKVTFTCRPLISEGFTHCSIGMYHEFADDWQEIEMALAGVEGDRLCYTVEVTAPKKPDLTWYHFRFWRDDGSGCIMDKTGYRSDGHMAAWQMTTYRPDHTPEWFGRGATYQIFPDRFRRTSIPSPEGLVGNRWVHEDWNDPPEWRPDPDGEIRNRDFFGGSLAGITEKLDELAAMGVKTLYLCPIFESASNHRYNTADYTKIDPFLGDENDFHALCDAAHARGMKLLLDGVFNHTGSQSLYFNEDGFYPTLGAAQSKKSPYYNWFQWKHWPDDFESWWGIKTLPSVREECRSYVDYIIKNDDSVIRRWLRAGADGWRLDVADELPDSFIRKIRAVLEQESSDAFLLGEVWEDASNKISYDERRRYILGGGLHGVMNYPFRTGIMNWLKGGSAAAFKDSMETLRENYPPAVYYSAMNFLGTHDTPRILTVLGAKERPESRTGRAAYRLSPEERALGLARVKVAAAVMFAFPGSPTIYYGDEAGLEGWEDPFNRGSYPWGSENAELKAHFTALGAARSEFKALQQGEIRYLAAGGPILAFVRETSEQTVLCAANADSRAHTVHLPWQGETARDLLSGKEFTAENGVLTLPLEPISAMLLV